MRVMFAGHYQHEENSNLLDQTSKQISHTSTVKLLYIAKRVRPDVLLAVNFLTSRVKQPTAKLMRVLKYLLNTKHMGLTLNIEFE